MSEALSRGRIRLSPRARGVIAMIATSVITSSVTGAVAIWSLEPPLQLPRLVFAVAACLVSIAFGALIGRVVARRAAEGERVG